MFISKMKISNFRSFQKETEFNLVRGINLITGLNGIGKSTILALLTNSTEFKSTNPLEKPYLGDAFRGEFSDVILYDEKSDNYAKNSINKPKSVIYFEDRPSTNLGQYPLSHTYKSSLSSTKKQVISHKKLKLTAQLLTNIKKDNSFLQSSKQILVKQINKKEIPRFRFLPDSRTVNGKQTRAKVKWPTLYLGLSRVYPTGENDSAEVKEIPSDTFLSDLPQIHKNILDEKFELADVTTNSIKGSDAKKYGSGIETENFGALSNSIGQTNLGQILLAVKSFERLQSSLGDEYFGGLLAIDEIDATLHPAAQNELLKYLYDESQKLNLQIVLTTHSLSLIDFFYDLKSLKKNDDCLQVLQLDYKSGSNDIEVIVNPPISRYTNVLTKRMGSLTPSQPKVKVLTEDDVARWFLEKLFEKFNALSPSSHLTNLKLLDVSLGWENLLKLINSDYEYYKNMISIVDPDVSEEKINAKSFEYIEKFNFNKSGGNLFSIPGEKSIENIFYHFIFSESSNKMFEQQKLRNQNITRDMMEGDLTENEELYKDKKSHGINSFSVKQWYKHNRDLMEYSFDFLFEVNREDYFKWMSKLNTSAKTISSLLKS